MVKTKFPRFILYIHDVQHDNDDDDDDDLCL